MFNEVSQRSTLVGISSLSRSVTWPPLGKSALSPAPIQFCSFHSPDFPTVWFTHSRASCDGNNAVCSEVQCLSPQRSATEIRCVGCKWSSSHSLSGDKGTEGYPICLSSLPMTNFQTSPYFGDHEYITHSYGGQSQFSRMFSNGPFYGHMPSHF